MSLLPTRGQQALASGITPKILGARTRKAIAEIESRIEKLSGPYEEIDNSVVSAQADLQVAFEKFKQHILDTQKYLEESAA